MQDFVGSALQTPVLGEEGGEAAGAEGEAEGNLDTGQPHGEL